MQTPCEKTMLIKLKHFVYNAVYKITNSHILFIKQQLKQNKNYMI